MTWVAPAVDRVEEPKVGYERTILEGWLEWHRQTLLGKCTGLNAEQLKTASAPPSNLTLLGLVRHMREVEHSWFTVRPYNRPADLVYCSDESPDGDFDDIADADAETDLALFVRECQTSRDSVAPLSLDHTFTHPRHGEMSLRWVYVHMVEEYARHNGHADLIRERIDGATGA